MQPRIDALGGDNVEPRKELSHLTKNMPLHGQIANRASIERIVDYWGNKTWTSSSRWQIISLFSIQETPIIHICTDNSPLERPLRTSFRFIRFRFAGSVDESLGLFGVVGFWFCFACHETDHIRVTDAQPINLRLAMSASCPVYP